MAAMASHTDVNMADFEPLLRKQVIRNKTKSTSAVKTLPTSTKEKGSPWAKTPYESYSMTPTRKRKSLGTRNVTSSAPILTLMMRGGKIHVSHKHSIVLSMSILFA